MTFFDKQSTLDLKKKPLFVFEQRQPLFILPEQLDSAANPNYRWQGLHASNMRPLLWVKQHPTQLDYQRQTVFFIIARPIPFFNELFWKDCALFP